MIIFLYLIVLAKAQCPNITCVGKEECDITNGVCIDYSKRRDIIIGSILGSLMFIMFASICVYICYKNIKQKKKCPKPKKELTSL